MPYTAVVWVDPKRRSGEPCIFGTRIPTHMIAGLVWDRGLSFVHGGWPHISDEQIYGACWFEVTHGNRRKWRKSFSDWPKTYSRDEWEARAIR